MSYDLLVYSDRPDCPRDGIQVILAGLRPVEGGGRLTEHGPGEWELSADTSVWVGISPVGPGARHGCTPAGARWRVVSSTSAGRGVHAVWLQFAVVFHLAVLLPGMTVHNCQIAEHSTYPDSETFRRAASTSMGRLASVRLLRRFGYVDDDGLPVF